MITRRYRRSTRLLLAATAVPPVRSALVPAASLAPGVFGRCVAAVGGDPAPARGEQGRISRSGDPGPAEAQGPRAEPAAPGDR